MTNVLLKKVLCKVRDVFLLAKVYVQRPLTYLALINSCMILYLFLVSLEQKGIIKTDLESIYIQLLVACFVILFIVGWFETKVLKGKQKEMSLEFDFHPRFLDIKNKVDFLYKQKMNELNEKVEVKNENNKTT